MEFLKRNGIGLLAILCCGALGLLLTQQNRQIHDLGQENAALMTRLDAMEAAAAPVEEAYAEIVSSTVDGERRTLTIAVNAVIPESEPNYVVGLCQPGEPYQSAWDTDLLQRQTDGSYASTLTFPLDLDMGLELRLEDDTVLFSTDCITDLLPLQFSRHGISYHFNSEAQAFYACDFSVGLTDLSGQEVRGRDGAFRIYRNGELVFTGNEIVDSYAAEVDGEIWDDVGVDCTEGDRMRISYTCTDDAGLRYEVTLLEIQTWKWDGAGRCSISGRPTVTWVE